MRCITRPGVCRRGVWGRGVSNLWKRGFQREKRSPEFSRVRTAFAFGWVLSLWKPNFHTLETPRPQTPRLQTPDPEPRYIIILLYIYIYICIYIYMYTESLFVSPKTCSARNTLILHQTRESVDVAFADVAFQECENRVFKEKALIRTRMRFAPCWIQANVFLFENPVVTNLKRHVPKRHVYRLPEYSISDVSITVRYGLLHY